MIGTEEEDSNSGGRAFLSPPIKCPFFRWSAPDDELGLWQQGQHVTKRVFFHDQHATLAIGG